MWMADSLKSYDCWVCYNCHFLYLYITDVYAVINIRIIFLVAVANTADILKWSLQSRYLWIFLQIVGRLFRTSLHLINTITLYKRTFIGLTYSLNILVTGDTLINVVADLKIPKTIHVVPTKKHLWNNQWKLKW